MGSQWFEVRISDKKTAKAAFNEAVKEALYDYGHSGYTGSIAEKQKFIMLNDKPLEPNEAKDLVRKIEDEGDDRIDDKWGPAGCIKLTTKEYIFIGWASS
jgi:hypothetical protein